MGTSPGTQIERYMAESDIKKSIRDLFNHLGIWVWGSPNGPMIHGRGRMTKTNNPGMPDLMGILPDGIALHIEVKKPGHKTNKKRLSEQKAWIAKVNDNGGVGFFAESTEDVYNELMKRGYVEKPWIEA